jgi:predicted DNA-binding protein (UPF0251 family)
MMMTQTASNPESPSRPAITPIRALKERRAAMAWELTVVRRLTAEKAAAALGCSRATVVRDLQSARDKLRTLLRKQRSGEAGMLDAAVTLLAEADGVARAAWADYVAVSASSPNRPRLLRLALESTVLQQRLLESVGVLDGDSPAAEVAAFGAALSGDTIYLGRLADHELALLRGVWQLMKLAALAEGRQRGSGFGILARAEGELRGLLPSGEDEEPASEQQALPEAALIRSED